MATYDLLMIAILAGLALYGYFKGLAWQLAYITSLVASYFVAVRFADRLAPSITFVNPPLNKFAAMLIIHAATSLAIWMVFRIVRGFIDKVKLESFDHQMGAVAGLFRGALWCVAVTFFAVTLLPQTQKQQIIASKSGRYIARLLDETDSLFPPEVHQVIGPYLDRLESELDGTAPTNQFNNGFNNGFNQSQQQGQPFGWPSGNAQTQQPTSDAISGLVQGFAQQAASQFANQQPSQQPTQPPRFQQPSGFQQPQGFQQPPRQASGAGTNASSLGWPQR